jgi:hypothetical protein
MHFRTWSILEPTWPRFRADKVASYIFKWCNIRYIFELLRAIFGWILKGLFLNNSITQLTQKQAVEGFKPLTHEEHSIFSANIAGNDTHFPNPSPIYFQQSCRYVSLSGQVLYFVNLHRPTYQESTPTCNIALLILCSRQAIVPLMQAWRSARGAFQ